MTSRPTAQSEWHVFDPQRLYWAPHHVQHLWVRRVDRDVAVTRRLVRWRDKSGGTGNEGVQFPVAGELSLRVARGPRLAALCSAWLPSDASCVVKSGFVSSQNRAVGKPLGKRLQKKSLAASFTPTLESCGALPRLPFHVKSVWYVCSGGNSRLSYLLGVGGGHFLIKRFFWGGGTAGENNRPSATSHAYAPRCSLASARYTLHLPEFVAI